MMIGYARAHSRDRDLHLQRAALKRAGCEFIVEVLQTDVQAHRDGLKKVLSTLNQGDLLVVRKLDRLASGLKQWMAISAALQERGIALRVLGDRDENGAADTEFNQLLSALAEYEKAKRNQRAGTVAHSAQPFRRRRGRPRGTDEAKRAAALALRKETACSITKICEIVGISRPTYYRYYRAAKSDAAADTQTVSNESASYNRRSQNC